MSLPRPNSTSSGTRTTDVGGVVRGWRLATGLTLRQLAQRAGCTPGFLSGVENGRKRASPDLLARLESALGLHPDELRVIAHTMDAPPGMRRRAEEQRQQHEAARELAELLRSAGGRPGAIDGLFQSGRLARLIDRVAPEPAASVGAAGSGSAAGPVPGSSVELAYTLPVEVPVINSVAAGYPTEFTDLGYPARVADSYVRQPDIRDPDAFGARVVGDSMEPEYHEGDIVVFSPGKPVLSGMDCFVRIEPDHETTFKRVYFEPDAADAAARGLIRLQPLNSKYASRTLPREQVAGLYAAVSVTRMIGGGG
ncbi:MAG: helix-turn-helix domain-containing protein [Phycisphaerales bacterium]